MDPIDSWVDAAEMRRLAESLVAPAPEVKEAPNAGYDESFVGFEKPAPSGATQSARVDRTSVAAPPVENHARAALAGARQLAERGGMLSTQQVPAAPVSSAPPPRPVPVPSQAAPAAAATAVAPNPAPASRPVAAAPQTSTMTTPEGLFMERLKAYGDWLHKAVSAKAFFVADREGELLIDEVHSPKLLQVARTLAQASWTANRQAGGGPAVGSLHVKLGAGSILEVLPVSSHYGPLILGLIVPGLLPAATVQVVATSLQKVVDGPIQRS